jgi:negative regulator of flagellin synthesis FlgM
VDVRYPDHDAVAPTRRRTLEFKMKIGQLDNKPLTTTQSAERKAADAKAGGATPEPSAKVELSSAASLLSGSEVQADFDAEKVERIAQAIRDGKFQVNPEAIADKLIANAAELLGRQPQ